MKKAINILVLGVALLGAPSCSNDFFEKAPTGAFDAGKIDASSITYMRNAIYDYLGANNSGYDAPFQDGYADNGYSRNDWDSFGKRIQTNTITAAEDLGYSFAYQGIRRCNLLLSKLASEPLDQALKDKYIAEARVMRAWLYMDLTLRFGSVPLVLEALNDYPEGLERKPANEIRKFVLDELDAALTVLPTQNDPNTFNKAQTYAIKARAAYFFGDYAKAEEAAKYVIQHGGYRLHQVKNLAEYQADADYFKKLFTDPSANKDQLVQGIFNYEDIWRRDNSPETIIAKEFTATQQQHSWARTTCFQTPNTVDKEAWNTIAPIQQLVDCYWTLDGKTRPQLKSEADRRTSYTALEAKLAALKGDKSATATVAENLKMVLDDEFMAQFKNRDPRLYATVVFPYASISKYKSGEYQVYQHQIVNYGRTGYFFRKFSGAYDVIDMGWYFGTGVDFPIIRLAEMYLIAAEAHTQNKGYDAEAQSYLNLLRDRVNMPHVPTDLAKNEALEFIRSERRIEMAGEGLRFFDIRLYEDNGRNGGYKGQNAASAVMKGTIYDVVGNKGIDMVWHERLNLMPLPTTALDKNKHPESKKNNPGY